MRERLEKRADLELVSIPQDKRKDPEARRAFLNRADAVVLCLPDDAAREAVGLIENPSVKVIDASTAHRVAPGWVYGFPEMSRNQRDAIRRAQRVANPGCWPTGFIALVRPLVEAALLPADWPVTANGVSGYSGGGKSMIAEFEDPDSPSYTRVPYRIYGMTQAHKHVPEMKAYALLSRGPMFAPSVGRYHKGMIVEVLLPLDRLPGRPTLARVHDVIASAYAGERFVDVVSMEVASATKTLDPEALNGTNRLRLFVFGHDTEARLVAQLDNLGKGASGAAAQNLNLMLGLDESAGLD